MSFHWKGGYDFNDLQLRPRWDGDQQTKPMNIPSLWVSDSMIGALELELVAMIRMMMMTYLINQR